MTGSVRAFRGIEFAIRRATDIVSGAVVDFAKHGVNRGNRNNLHFKFRFFRVIQYSDGRSGSRAGRGEVAGMDRIRPTKRSYNYQKPSAKIQKNFDICKDFYKNSAKKLILLQMGILLYRT